MDLLSRLAGQPDANESFMKQVQYATGAWSNLMENMTFKAAGRELLRAVESATPEKPVDEESVRKIGLKYNLTPDRMGQLKTMLVESGALPLALKEQQRKMRDEELLAKASEDTGLTSDAAMDARKKEYLNKVAPQPVALETYMEADGTPVQVPKGTPAPAGTVPLAVWKVNEQNEQREEDRRSRERMHNGGGGSGGSGGGNVEPSLNSDAIALASAEFLKSGKMPALGMRNSANRTLIINGAAQMAKERGIDPYKVPAIRTEFSALGKSLNNQQKIYNMMGGFVRNLDKQVDRVSAIHQDIVQRVGTRALDVPIRQLKTRFKGSGNEAILEAYMAEISNEIGKLSTGSSASIAELSIGAQERWSKIHDPNLSVTELLKILKETKDMGAMRINSTQEEIVSTKNTMDSIWSGGKQNTPSKAVSYLKGAKDRSDAIKRIQLLNKKGWSKADIQAAAKEAGWE